MFELVALEGRRYRVTMPRVVEIRWSLFSLSPMVIFSCLCFMRNLAAVHYTPFLEGIVVPAIQCYFPYWVLGNLVVFWPGKFGLELVALHHLLPISDQV